MLDYTPVDEHKKKHDPIRDYFAAHALANITMIDDPDAVAEHAFMIADAMVAEREKRRTE